MQSLTTTQKVQNWRGKSQWKTAESRFRQQKWKTRLQTGQIRRINDAKKQDCYV